MLDARIDKVEVAAYRVPTDRPESDGTLEWDSTTIVIAEVSAGGRTGLGYTYGDEAVAQLIHGKLASLVTGTDALDVQKNWFTMIHAMRNLGLPGLASLAISAVDVALWDLKARLLDLPIVRLLGQVHDCVIAYGSGGFTSYNNEQLRKQLGGWVAEGLGRVKMKVGRHPERDPDRVRAAREAIGPKARLYVDANGAYHRKQALALAETFAEIGVSWFEEPVSADDLDGLRLLRDRAPAGMVIAAGEYGYDPWYFQRMLEARAVDVLQADATRCGGISGFLRAAHLCEIYHLEFSAHTAPALHAHAGCAAIPLRDVEYFHDHARVERMFFDGLPALREGRLYPDLSAPGLGLTLRRPDVERLAA